MWQTLAPEVVIEILRHFLPDSKLSLTKPQQFPWYLGHVCRIWRGVFLSFPQFWTTFIIDITENFQVGDLERAPMILKTCLTERGGGLPISFKFSAVSLPYCDRPSLSQYLGVLYCGQILDILVAHSARWHDAYFTLPATQLRTIYHVKDRVPILRSFQLTLNDKPTKDVEFCNHLLVTASQLRRVYLHDTEFKLWKANWSSLTTIHFKYPILPTMLLSSLKRTSCLEELVIRQDYGSDFELSSISPIALPFLRVLHAPSLDTLPLLEMHALEDLFVRNDLCIIPTDNPIMEMINTSTFRSLPRLRRLSIIPEDEGDLAQLIQFMPASVQDLSVYGDLAIFLRVISESSTARNLKMLTVATWYPLEFHEYTLLSRITSWRRETTGIGPFENLMRLSLVLPQEDWAQNGNSDTQIAATPEEFVKLLGHHLEEEGIQYSIQFVDAESADQFADSHLQFNLL